MRKICSVLTVLILIALCLFLLPTQSQAADIPGAGVCGENLIYTYVNDLLMIQGSGPMTNFDYENKAPWETPDSPIKRIIIHDGVTSIGDYAFSSCTQLEELTLPGTLTQIGKNAFTGCSIKTLTLPDSVESIGSSAFSYCDNLTDLTLSSNLKTIGESAFYNCLKLQDVTIPANVSKIESSAFSACTSLTKIQVDTNNAAYISDESGVLFDKDLTTLVQMPGGFTGSYTVPSTVTSISDRAFHTCRGLAEVILPDGLTSIGADAFSFCTNLTTLSIPGSVTSFGEAPFRYCDKLTFTTYGNGQYLGNSGNPYLVLVSVTSKTATEYSIPTGTKFICDRAFEKCSALKSITIPDSVIYIGAGAFSRCSALTDVTIGNGLTRIKSNTFQECSALTTVTLGSQVAAIDEQAFYGCFVLQSINFPRGLTTISRLSFAGCLGLTSIAIPDSITLIDLDAFAYCQNLTAVTYCGTEEQWEKYKVGFYSVPLENIQVSYHAFTDATCTSPSICPYCDLTAADALGHTPGEEATETTDQICTVCGEVLVPAFGEATVPVTTPATNASAPAESVPDSDEDGSNSHVVIWIIVGTVIAAGAAAGGFFLYKKYKPQTSEEPQEIQE